jgi:hypothetical protein
MRRGAAIGTHVAGAEFYGFAESEAEAEGRPAGGGTARGGELTPTLIFG